MKRTITTPFRMHSVMLLSFLVSVVTANGKIAAKKFALSKSFLHLELASSKERTISLSVAEISEFSI